MTKEYATLAGGCFWCMVKPFTSYPGIKSVVSGYSGGHVDNPTYEQVCTNQTGHVEAVQITFDPEVTSFENILDIYFKTFDPAEDYHQDYYKKNPVHYYQYQRGSGRKAFIESHWGNQNA
ncbi:TPA: peptide-methionine (S)-S-oxide reductase [Staphylococcus aureus]